MTVVVGEPINKLQVLRDSLPRDFISTENEAGKEWAPRFRRADDYFKENSDDWEYLRGLSAKPYHEITITDGDQVYSFRVKIDISSIIKNMVADIYYRNPEPFIQARRTPRDKATNRMLSDLGVAIHKMAGTEDEMKKALYNAFAVTGGSILWTSFDQYGDWVEKPVPGQYDESMQPVMADTFEPSFERPKVEFVSLWRMRFDPDGRNWNFCDHQHVFRLYDRPLQDVYEDEKFDEDFRNMLVHWVASNRQNRMSSESRINDETDPARILVTFAEGWDRVTKSVVHLPIGPDGAPANFAAVLPMPSAFAKAKNGAGAFPARMVAADWVPPDKEQREGFYPIPTARRLRGLIEDMTRLYSLFFQSARAGVRKYIAVEGVLAKDDFSKVMSTDADDIILAKAENLRQVYGPNLEGLRSMKQLIESIDTGEDRQKAIEYSVMIDKVWEQIYQITGQGPGDRGGVSQAGSATEAANIKMQLDKRTADAVAEVGKAYDDITELLFLLLIEYQSLPIPYQLTTNVFSQPVWDEFQINMLYGMDLAFSHVADSSRPKNKAVERLERKEFLAVAAPFVKSKRMLNKLVSWAFQPYDYPDPSELFEDPLPEIAKQGAKMLMKLKDKDGKIDVTDPNVGRALIENYSALIDASLTEADMEELAMGEAQMGADSVNPAGTGPASQSAGEYAAAGAAAGRSTV
jgi:hypothetical protein